MKKKFWALFIMTFCAPAMYSMKEMDSNSDSTVKKMIYLSEKIYGDRETLVMDNSPYREGFPEKSIDVDGSWTTSAILAKLGLANRQPGYYKVRVGNRFLSEEEAIAKVPGWQGKKIVVHFSWEKDVPSVEPYYGY